MAYTNRGYKIYTALLTQTGTDAPVATVLENTLGTVTWGREDAGLYYGTFSTSFDTSKTYIYIQQSSSSPNIKMHSNVKNANVNVKTFNMDDDGVDNQLSDTSIEIKVYD